jgi:hypothetical protein
MAYVRSTHRLAKALEAEGLLPPHCRFVDIVLPADGVTTIRYEVFVSREDLGKLATAFAAAAVEPPTEPEPWEPPDAPAA